MLPLGPVRLHAGGPSVWKLHQVIKPGHYRHRVGRGQITVSRSVVGKPGFHRRQVGGEQRTASTLANHWVAGEARAVTSVVKNVLRHARPHI